MHEEKQQDEYDGFYLLPSDDEEDEDGLKMTFFDLDEEFTGGTPIDSSSIGLCYHVAFFKQDEEGNAVFDEHFEAVFSHPQTYVRGLVGGNIYGCFLKKTTKSGKWFEDYLKRAKTYVRMDTSNNDGSVK
jgi:hypothetical protein